MYVDSLCLKEGITSDAQVKTCAGILCAELKDLIITLEETAGEWERTFFSSGCA